MTPTTDWPAVSGMMPTLAPVYNNGGSAKSSAPGSSRESVHHVDLFEAAERFKAIRQSGYQQSPLSQHIGSTDKVGRTTMVRSETDDFRAPLMSGEIQRKPLPSDTRKAGGGPPMTLFHEVCFVTIICLAQALMLAGIAQALVPAFIIGASFPGTTPGDLAWYSAAYGLTAGTFVLPAGRLGDLYGHKKIFTVGFLWFALWSLLAGFSIFVQTGGGNGTIYFCFCRAMQGIGPALQVPNGQAMLGRIYPPGPRRALVMSLLGASAPLGFVAGAVMSSLFAIKASWEWAFFVLAAVNLALAGLGILILPTAELKRKVSDDSLWQRLDGPGILLGVSGLVLFNFAFNQAPIVGWNTPYTYFILVIGVMLCAAFVYVERHALHPLVPVSAMTAKTNFVLACTGCGWGCFSVWVFYAFQIIEVLRGWNPLLASAGFAHAPISGLAASLLVAVLLGKIHMKPTWVMLISMCAFFVGSLLMATAPVEQNYWFNTFFSILIMPFGMDMSNPAATILLSNSVSKEHQGIAASLVLTVVNYSISLALGIAGSIEVGVNDHGRDLLKGYRGAQYFSLGLGVLGIVLALAFVVSSYRRSPPAKSG
jgi:MFS family permease